MNELIATPYQMTVADPSAIAAAEAVKARIQSAYIMAINRPRNADDARIRILDACKRPEFAARVEFSKPVGGRSIKGPSIRFAETALRLWGNIDSDIQVVYDDANFRRINVRITDLETNSTFSKQLNIRKTVERKNAAGRDGIVVGERMNSKGEKVFIVQSTDDELMNKENALISKALRNEGLRLIPSDIIDEALATAQNTLRDRDAKDPAAAKKRLFDAFASIGVKPKDLEKHLKHSVDSISPAEIENLRAIYTAIKEGDATWGDYSATEEEQKPPVAAAPPKFNDAPPPEEHPPAYTAPPNRGRKPKPKETPAPSEQMEALKEQAAKPPEVVEQFPARQAPGSEAGPTIGHGLEDTDEWSVMNDLIRSNRSGYLQAKISLKMSQGPTSLEQVKLMIAELEKGARQPGEDDN